MTKPAGKGSGGTWAVEITAAEGMCRAYLVYTGWGKQTTIWETTTWTLPDIPLTPRLMLQELMDVCLVLQEQMAT